MDLGDSSRELTRKRYNLSDDISIAHAEIVLPRKTYCKNFIENLYDFQYF